MSHFVSASCEGEKCRICKSPATHKVGEEIMADDPNPVRHNLTAYVCCKHFRRIMGPAVACPYITKKEETMKKAKMVMHHDDFPCKARLDDAGDCPKCNCHPDMQSLQLWPYCPSCDCPLKKLRCPKCKQTFDVPN